MKFNSNADFKDDNNEDEQSLDDMAEGEDTMEAPPEGKPLGAEKSLEDRLREAEAKRDEYLEMAQRMKAEFENFRRRNNAVRSEAWEDGARETIALLLPVIDNLERALAAAVEKTPLRDGLELVLRQMVEILEKRGVTVINRLGEPFDPEQENAVMQADVSEGEPGTVCQVLQKGYQTKNRVIRHAMVRVVAAE